MPFPALTKLSKGREGTAEALSRADQSRALDRDKNVDFAFKQCTYFLSDFMKQMSVY